MPGPHRPHPVSRRSAAGYAAVIAGGGLAGLSLAAHLAASTWRDRRVLIVFDSVTASPGTPAGAQLAFTGWEVRYADPVFDADTPTLFDFRVPQGRGSRFVYVLPADGHRALVELTAERAAVATLGATCDTPVGVCARLEGDGLTLQGFAGLPDGSEWVRDRVEGDPGQPAALGEALAERMLAAGAGEVLARAAAASR